MTPEEKLCSRWWRIRNSVGMFWPILSFGLLGGVGLLVRGIKAKRRLWIGLGAGFLAIGLFLLISSSSMNAGSGTKANPTPTVASTLWGWIMLGNFVGSLTTMIVTNRAWLRWKAHSNASKWYAEGAAPPQSLPIQTQAYQALNGIGGVGPATQPAYGQHQNPKSSQRPETVNQLPSEQASPTIDVNRATAEQLQHALLLDAQTANAIVNTRGQGFGSFEELLGRAGVQPHLLVPLRNKLAFSVPVPNPQAAKPNKHALHDL